MKKPEGDYDRAVHVLEAIAEIEKYTKGVSFDEFIDNSMMFNATLRQLEIIGEACNNISKATQEKFTDINWKDINGFRNIIVHQYFGMSERLIWQIIQDNLPELKKQIAEITDL